jgi:hypothetical protein
VPLTPHRALTLTPHRTPPSRPTGPPPSRPTGPPPSRPTGPPPSRPTGPHPHAGSYNNAIALCHSRPIGPPPSRPTGPHPHAPPPPHPHAGSYNNAIASLRDVRAPLVGLLPPEWHNPISDRDTLPESVYHARPKPVPKKEGLEWAFEAALPGALSTMGLTKEVT